VGGLGGGGGGAGQTGQAEPAELGGPGEEEEGEEEEDDMWMGFAAELMGSSASFDALHEHTYRCNCFEGVGSVM
jgi:hypothetical protein